MRRVSTHPSIARLCGQSSRKVAIVSEPGKSLTAFLIAAVATTLVGCGASVSSEPAEPGRVSASSPESVEPTSEPTSPESVEPVLPPDPTPAALTEPAADPAAQSEALDEYLAAEQSQLPKLKSDYADTYSEITIEAEHPDLIVYTYTFSGEMDKAKTVKHFEDMLSEFETAAQDQIFPIMEEYGVTPTQRIRYTYLAPDGSVLWTHDFASR